MLHIVIGALAVLTCYVTLDFFWHWEALGCLTKRSFVGENHRSTFEPFRTLSIDQYRVQLVIAQTLQIIFDFFRQHVLIWHHASLFSFCDRFNFFPAVTSQLTKIFERYKSFCTCKTIKALLLVLDIHFYLYLIKRVWKFMKMNPVFVTSVEKAKSVSKWMELQSHPLCDQIKLLIQFLICF